MHSAQVLLYVTIIRGRSGYSEAIKQAATEAEWCGPYQALAEDRSALFRGRLVFPPRGILLHKQRAIDFTELQRPVNANSSL